MRENLTYGLMRRGRYYLPFTLVMLIVGGINGQICVTYMSDKLLLHNKECILLSEIHKDKTNIV